MPSNILNGSKKIDFSDMKFTPAKPLAKGKVVNVKMNNSAVRIKTPKMLHWGASDYEGDNKFKLHLQFPSGDDKTDATNALLDNMQSIYDAVLKHAVTNSKEWFGKQLKEESIRDDKLHQFLSRSTSAEGNVNEPVLRVKFNKIKERYTCEIYDEDKNSLWVPDEANNYPDQTPMQHFQKGGKAVSILELGGITIINGKAYIGMNLFQAVSYSNPNAHKGGCLIDDDEGEPTTVFKKTEIDTAVESSDEEEEVEEEVEVEVEEEEEEEPEPEPEPIKTVKKKVIKKKV